MSTNPKNDSGMEGLDSDFSVNGGVITMHPNGPTSFSVGRNCNNFSDSIGGCNMDFKDTAARGYSYKASDVRDLEYKCVMKFNNIGDNGFSISCCTGHHSGSNCCQGFAYMFNVQANSNPADFRFRKEMWHVSYHDSPEGVWTHPKANFKLDGHGWFGFGFCRYNDPASPNDTVILEGWFNPTPETDKTNWIMLKRIKDKPGNGWGNDGDDCGGAKDQVGTWSGAHNRLKTNSTNGSIDFKEITFREIDPNGDFDNPPTPSTVTRKIHYALITGTDPLSYAKLTDIISHEITETQTSSDPHGHFEAQGWRDYSVNPTLEIADICGSMVDDYPDGLRVQGYWSNSDNNCVIPHLNETDLGSSSDFTTHGGTVLIDPKIYLIYWGNDWKNKTSSPTASGITDKIQNGLLDADIEYFAKLSQYGGVQAPVWGGAVFNTSMSVPSTGTITEQMGQNVITNTIATGLLPIPEDDHSAIYILMAPVGKAVQTMSGSKAGGFHDVMIQSFTVVDQGGPPGGGGGGGGSGGDKPKDDFGINMLYPTASGGRVWNSNWHTATTHQWDSATQIPGQLDPQDSMADLVAPSTCRAIVNSTTKTLQADTNSDKNSWRYYIKDPACTKTSSPWKWSESCEVTVYYKALVDFGGGSIHVHCRVMGPGEHWNAITDNNPDGCGAAGHEYSYEIKKNGTNQFRKEQVHVGGDAGGYSENIIFPDHNAPYNTWIGMKLTTQLQSGKMKVQAWKDLTDGVNGGTWIKAGEIIDDGTNWKLPSPEAIANFNSLPAGSGNCTKISPMDCALTMDGSAVGLRVDNTRVQFKKFSCREIDPASAGTGGGGGGGGTETPPTTSTITGSWKILSDINTYRNSPCAGSSGGGGSGGTAKFYSVPAVLERGLSDDISHENRKRLVQKISGSASPFVGVVPLQADIWLRKSGSPGATPVIQAKIWDSAGNVIATASNTIAPNTLTTTMTKYSFDFSGNTHSMIVNDRIGVEWLGTGVSDYVVAAYSESEGTGSSSSFAQQYEGTTWQSFTDRNMAMDVWE